MLGGNGHIKIFAGSASKQFAQKMCDYLGSPMGDCTTIHFSEGNTYVRFNECIRDMDVYFVQTIGLNANNEFMELLFYIDAAKRASANSISVIMPYFSYAKGDKKDEPRVSIRARVCADAIEMAGADRVVTMDLHAAQIQGFFDIPVDNLLGNPIFTNYLHDRFNGKEDEMIVVSPDVGSVARARAFAQKLDMPLAIVDKRRQKANSCEVMNVIGDVRGKDCILFDDLVDTAGSLCNAATALMEVGGAKSVHACASHGVLSGPAIERLNNSCIQELALLDTIPAIDPAKSDKIKYLSVANMFAEAIERIYEEISVSKLFN